MRRIMTFMLVMILFVACGTTDQSTGVKFVSKIEAPTHTPRPAPTSTPAPTPMAIPTAGPVPALALGATERQIEMKSITGMSLQTREKYRSFDDSTWIAFSLSDGMSWSAELDIWIMRPDGSDMQQLTYEPGQESNPSWSPDGRHIAFSSTRDSRNPGDCDNGLVEAKCEFNLYIVNVETGEIEQITDSPLMEKNPQWSPDGKQMIYYSKLPGARNAGISVVDLESKAVTEITDGSEGSDSNPTWSPDGKYIAFGRTNTDENGQLRIDIYTLELATGDIQRLTDERKSNVCPVWSPDGQRIAYIGLYPEDEGAGQLLIMNADGSEKQTRFLKKTIHPAFCPSWAPDSKQLVSLGYRPGYVNSINFTNDDGSNQYRGYDGQSYMSGPNWSPEFMEP